jgi:hypothetical protein
VLFAKCNVLDDNIMHFIEVIVNSQTAVDPNSSVSDIAEKRFDGRIRDGTKRNP